MNLLTIKNSPRLSTLFVGKSSKSGTRYGEISPYSESSFALSGESPLSAAAFTVSTDFPSSPISSAAAASSLYGENDAINAPIFLGLPAVGPFPSMPTTASIMYRRGLKCSFKSMSIFAKSVWFGKR